MLRKFFHACLLTFSFSQAFGDIPNYAIADLVIGKPDFSAQPAPRFPEYRAQPKTSSFSIGAPEDIAIDPKNQKLFISDSANNRVLRYSNYDSFKIGQAAETVFGQPDFESNSPSTTDMGMNSPRGIFLDSQGRLWVADTRNHRILMFEDASGSNATRADKVFGQKDFVTSERQSKPVISADKSFLMSEPGDICIDDADRLWVADTYNSRVLWFDNVTAKPATGAVANGELGKAVEYDFYDFKGPAEIEDKTRLDYPSSVAVAKNGTLFVADPGRNRVLRFDNPTSPGGAVATGVFGKLNFYIKRSTIRDGGRIFEDTTPAERKLTNPGGLTVTSDNGLWVNNDGKIAAFYKNALSVSSPVPDVIVGQRTMSGYYDLNYGGSLSEKRQFCNQFYNHPSTYVDALGRLLVVDTNSNRVLRFSEDRVKPVAKSLRLNAERISKNRFLIEITGEAIDDYGIKSILFKLDNKPYKKFDAETIDFAFKVKRKKGTIRFKLVDPSGNVSVTYGGKYHLK